MSRPTLHSRVLIRGLVVAMLATLAFVAGPLPAAQAAVATGISGTVTAEGGGPLEDVQVTAYVLQDDGVDDPYWEEYDTAYTDQSGGYAIFAPNGTYRVGFEGSDKYVTEFWKDAGSLETATNVVVNNASVTTISPSLAVRKAVKGTVTGPTSATPLKDIQVTLYALDEGSWVDVRSTDTNQSGSYALYADPGTYRVGFSDPDEKFRSEFFDNASTVGAATSITVSGADQAGKNATLALNPTISGTVTGPGSVNLKGVEVTGYRYDADAGEWVFAAMTTTAANGTYSLGVPENATYRLGFEDSKGVYYRQYWNNKPTLNGATGIAVASSDVTGKNATLALRPTVSGVITSSAGNAEIEHATVTAFKSDGEGGWAQTGDAETDVTGAFKVSVDAGTVRLCVYATDHVDECFNDKPDLDRADDITVTAAGLTGKNAVLTAYKSIKGTITGPGGVPLSNGTVTVYRGYDNGEGVLEYYQFSDDYTHGDGTYALRLPPGTYKMQFGARGYADQFYNNKATLATANPLTLTSGSDLAGNNAQLTALKSITGTVTAPGGGPANYVYVEALQAVTEEGVTTWETRESADTNAAGFYSIPLPAGTYRIKFSGEAYKDQYWNGKTTVGAADNIVLAGADLGGKNATMVAALAISGTVTTPGGTDPQGVEVQAYRSTDGEDDGYVYSTHVGAGGAYSLPVGPGSYKLKFIDQPDRGDDTPAYRYVTEYFNDKFTYATADIITVTAASVTGKNIALTNNGKITGTVTAEAGGTPLRDVRVSVLSPTDVSGGGSTNSAYTGSGGTYGLFAPQGTYKLEFYYDGELGSGSYAVEYWDNKTTAASAADVVVAPGSSQSKSAALANGKTVSGTVTGPGGVPADGVEVTAYVPSGEDPGEYDSVAYATTASNGTYAMALKDGTYRLGFESPSFAYASEFWQDKQTLSTATPVTVAGANITGISPILAAGSGITGHVSGLDLDTTVSAYELVGGAWTEKARGYAYGDFGGDYRVQLPPGTYKLKFSDFRYPPQFWNAKQTFAGADTIVVSGGYVSGKNASLTGLPDLTISADPTITGSPRVGQTLTANDGTWGPAPVTLTRQWFADGDKIAGATGTTFVPTAAQLGTQISVQVTGTKSGYNPNRRESDVTAQVTNAAAAITPATPTITGTPKVGVTLTANPNAGSWTPSSGVAFTYEWFRGTTSISGATSSTYTPVAADLGQTIKVKVTGSKAGLTSGSATSAPTAAVVAADALTMTPGTVTVTGTAKLGQTLTANEGTWNPALSGAEYSYQWIRGTATEIAGATSKTYVPVAADVGQTLKVKVTGTKAGYTSANATSAATSAVAAGTMTVGAVTVTGTATIGSTLTTNEGTWNPALSGAEYSYQWIRGTATEIAGATSKTYAPVAADAGQTLKVRVTGTKAGYTSANATSAPTASVTGTMTAGTVTVTGTAKLGSTLTANEGTWSPALSGADYSYQWIRGASTEIAGATSKTYVPVAADVGQTLKVRVTGTKTGYPSANATSPATAAVAEGTITAGTVTITGTAKVGQTLTANEGTWSPALSGADYSYQWIRGASTEIAGATSKTYVPVAADVGQTLKVKVTGTKTSYTSANATSAATAPSVAGTMTPGTVSVSGSASVGSTLTANEGTWTPALSGADYSYQWIRGASTEIAGATTKTYVPVAADLGQSLKVRVTGTKTGYTSANATSPATALVASAMTPGTVTVSGTAKLGQTLTANEGTWNPALSGADYSYQWIRGASTEVVGATSKTYVPVAADLGQSLKVRVTGTKANYTTTSATSAATPSVTGTMTAGTVTVSGTATVGSTLTANEGTWSPALSGGDYSYQWIRGTSTAIAGATSKTYVPVAGDVGETLKVKVTGTKTNYTSANATSTPTASVTGTVMTPGTVTVSGTARPGQTLTANEGTWTPAGVTFEYQWIRGATDIAGATSKTYVPVTADLGQTLKVRVTGTKSGYTSVSATSVATAVVKAVSTVSVSAKGAKKKATFTITVKATGVTPTGKITIKLGSKTLKSGTLKSGKVTLSVTKQKKGNRKYTIIYGGDAKVLGKTVTKTVKIK